jgi:hypothetical protein
VRVKNLLFVVSILVGCSGMSASMSPVTLPKVAEVPHEEPAPISEAENWAIPVNAPADCVSPGILLSEQKALRCVWYKDKQTYFEALYRAEVEARRSEHEIVAEFVHKAESRIAEQSSFWHRYKFWFGAGIGIVVTAGIVVGTMYGIGAAK